MLAQLEAEFPAETEDGTKNREAVLQEIQQMVSDWLTGLLMEGGASDEEARRSSIAITTLGSYRLGVVHPGSDIDTLCIAPPNVRREDFFATFFERLNRHEHVTECVPIPDAYTPIIKLKMRGVCIDLLFARLARTPEARLRGGVVNLDTCREDDALKDMDEKSVRCLNGFRVADLILRLVPNHETFRRTLRFIKYWARRRGIYSNILGFFGGITWSLLVARVCQLYPHYSPSQLTHRFFRLWAQWDWRKPVLLCEITDPANVPGMTEFKVWNPKTNPADRQHLMPVITPAFPSMNSTYNVTETTKRIMLEEFKRGYETMKNVEARKATWSQVTEPFPFFTRFGHFLWLEVLAKTDEAYTKFSGFVESKLRFLVMELEAATGMITSVVHPNPVQYDLCGTDPVWPQGCGMFVGFCFSREQGAVPGQTVDLRRALTQFAELVTQWTEKDHYHGQIRCRLKRISRAELPLYAVDPRAAARRRPREGAGGAAEPAGKRPREAARAVAEASRRIPARADGR
ncbi:unnamed protein product [Prorocentrum cordatum]|uniref:Poly(A) polymerase n=1 Tax=Prorocentrum cordatum TaxID=2364126 RepID=A0ABN9V731_9DINO|nr:unnamed protein product [Polarella glacialis]